MALTPRAVARLEKVVREVVDQYAAPLQGRRGVVDLVAEFATPIPGVVISRITGVSLAPPPTSLPLQRPRRRVWWRPAESPLFRGVCASTGFDRAPETAL